MASVSKAAWQVDPEPLTVVGGRAAAVVVVDDPVLPPVVVFFEELQPAATITPSVARAAKASEWRQRRAVMVIQVLRGRDWPARGTPDTLSRGTVGTLGDAPPSTR